MISTYEVIGIRTISKNNKKYYLAYCKSKDCFNNDFVSGYTVCSCFVNDNVLVGDEIRVYYIRTENKYICIDY